MDILSTYEHHVVRRISLSFIFNTLIARIAVLTQRLGVSAVVLHYPPTLQPVSSPSPVQNVLKVSTIVMRHCTCMCGEKQPSLVHCSGSALNHDPSTSSNLPLSLLH
jgi:hypothetical protein